MSSKIKKFVTAIFSFVFLASVIGGMYAFTSKAESKNGLISYKWFQVNTNKAPGASLINTDVTYLGDGTTPPSGTGCGGSNYQCVSGFNASQVNGSNQLIGAQVPATEPSHKN